MKKGASLGLEEILNNFRVYELDTTSEHISNIYDKNLVVKCDRSL